MAFNNSFMVDEDSFTERNSIGDGQTYPASSDFTQQNLYDTKLDNKTDPDWSYSNAAWPQSPFSDSPLSSSASGGTLQEPSWNPFEQSFLQETLDTENVTFPGEDPYLGCSPIAYQSAFLTSGTSNGSNPVIDPAFVRLSAIDESVPFSEEETQLDRYPIPALASPAMPRQPAWGNSRAPRKSSMSENESVSHNHKRRKSSESTIIVPTAENTTSQLAHRLRSTSTTSTYRPATSSSSSSYQPSNNSKAGSRSNHNQVEKQYRNRLNGQFENLLRILPQDEVAAGGGERRVSKADVLVLAKKHIQQLERERRELESVNEDLEETVKDLKRKWVNLGGVCMP